MPMKRLSILLILLVSVVSAWAGIEVSAANAPEITSVEPSSVAINEIPKKIKIKGKNFASDAKVLFNGAAVQASLNSSGKKFTVKQANAPAQLFATDNTIDIQVITADGQTSNTVQLKVGTGTPPPPPPPPPTISSISPIACAPGSSFDATIIGSNFSGATALRFSNPAITAEILETSDTKLLAHISVAATATTGDSTFEVLGPGGTGSSGQISITIQNSTATALLITNSNTSIKPQESLQLRVQAVDDNGYPATLPEVSWVTDASNIATISSTGIVTGVAPGIASITASASNVQSATVDINVFQVESSTPPEPTGEGEIVVDSIGQIYQTDPDSHIVRLQKSFQEAMQLFAGIKNSPGATDGAVLSSQFNIPLGIALDERRNAIYIADTQNQSVRKIDLEAGSVTTILTKQNLQESGVSVFGIRGLAVDKNGSLFISDVVNQVIWFYDATTKQIRSLAGAIGQKGLADGQGTSARFSDPQGLQIDNTGLNAIVADTGNNVVRLVTSEGRVSTIGAITNKTTATEPALHTTVQADEAINGQQSSGAIDSSALFAGPRAVASDTLGNILVVGEDGAKLLLRRDDELISTSNVLPREVLHRAVACAITRDQLFILAPSRDNNQLTLFRLSMPNAAPRIGKVAPDTIPAGQSTIVTITGANFSRNTLVTINNVPISTVKVLSSTILTFTAFANTEGTFPLRVQTSTGVAEASITIARPSVTVFPPGLNFTVTAGSTNIVSQKITVQSRASRAIATRLLIGGSLIGPQIDINPNILPLQPNERKEATISVKASRALPGEYEGFLMISTDDLAVPLQIPLRVAVTKESSDSQISFSPASINFGKVTVGTSSPPQKITVKNITTQSIIVNQITTTGPFTGPSINKPFRLNPIETLDFSVGFRPDTTGSASGAITFTLDNGKQLSVNLSGEGIR